MKSDYIQIGNVSKSFHNNVNADLLVCNNLNINIPKGKVVSILGPSGCGKSTLLKLCAGLEIPTSGKLEINGLTPKQARNQNIFSYLTQNPVLLPWLTVKKNVELPGKILKDEMIKNNSSSLIELVGLTEFADHYPNQLSGGMQSRVALARAYLTNPQLLLLDEPFASLDDMTRTTMQNELQKLFINPQTTILLVTHSIEEAIYLSDKIFILSKRPCEVLKIIDIEIDRPRDWEVRITKQFIEYKNEIRHMFS